MKSFVPGVLLLQLLFLLASPCQAEELEPRRWAHLPINTSFIGSRYACTESEIGPQIGAVHMRGKWSWETTGTVVLYCDNDDFFNGKNLLTAHTRHA